MKRIIVSIINFFSAIKYEIGFLDMHDMHPKTSVLSNDIHWIQYRVNKEDGWFADPFIVSVEGNAIEVLAEEFLYKEQKGRISLLTIIRENDTFRFESSTPILDLTTHLSFPYIYQEKGEVYICPENCNSGGVSLYKYNPNTHQIDLVNEIINDPLVDVQLFKANDSYYALGVKYITGSMDETKILSVYRSDELCGKYQLVQTITNERKEERGAGLIWKEDGYYVRPAQCCEGGYGSMLIMYRLDIINGSIKESELYRYKPSRCSKNGLSLHTYNKMGNICVVDGHDYKNVRLLSRIIAPIIKKIYGVYEQRSKK